MQKASANRQSTDFLCVGQKTANEMGEAKLSTLQTQYYQEKIQHMVTKTLSHKL